MKDPEKITGKQAVEGSIYLTLLSVLLKLIGLVAMVILTSALGVKGYGLYVLLLSIHGFLSSFQYLAPADVVTADLGRFIGASETGKIRRLLLEYLSIQTVMALVVAIMLMIAAHFVGVKYGSQVQKALPLISFMLVLTAARNVFNVTLNSHGAFRTIATWRSVEAVFRLILIMILILWFKTGIIGALLADAFSELAAMAIMVPALRIRFEYLRKHRSFRQWLLPGILRSHGKWSVLQAAGVNTTANLRLWIITYILNVEAVGLYAVAKRMLSFSKSIMPIKTVLIPTFAQNVHDASRVQTYFLKSIKYKFLLAVVIVIFGNIFASPIMVLLFPKYYPASVSIFQILLLVMFTKSFTEVFIPLFNATQTQKYSFLVFAASLVPFIILCPLLTYYFGINGAALEHVISSFIGVLLGYRLVLRLYPSLRRQFGQLFIFDNEDREFWRNLVPVGRLKKNSHL
jgi:O-antigen/teichoic acid export membrane protein